MKTIKKFEEIAGGWNSDKWQFYTKRPVDIRAMELEEEIEIETREGKLKGYVGDFLIEGVEGEIYPCGREIFFKTYELAPDEKQSTKLQEQEK